MVEKTATPCIPRGCGGEQVVEDTGVEAVGRAVAESTNTSQNTSEVASNGVISVREALETSSSFGRENQVKVTKDPSATRSSPDPGRELVSIGHLTIPVELVRLIDLLVRRWGHASKEAKDLIKVLVVGMPDPSPKKK